MAHESLIKEVNTPELVKALHYCVTKEGEITVCNLCPYFDKGGESFDCEDKLHNDAAAAIEALQALLKEADKKQAYQHDYICELVAEIEELKSTGLEVGKAGNKFTLNAPEQPHWVSVFNDLPRHNAVVVVSDGKRSWDVGQYHFLFNADDRTIWWWKKHTTRKVLWWMYKEDAIPEPPQEV